MLFEKLIERLLLLWRQVVWKEKGTSYATNIPYEFQENIEDIILLIELYNLLWKYFVFNSPHIGLLIINEWTGVAMICCYGKNSFYIQLSNLFRYCNDGLLSLKYFSAFQSSIPNEI